MVDVEPAGRASEALPAYVAVAVAGVPEVDVVAVAPLAGGTGAATADVARVTARTPDGRELTLVRKSVRPLRAGRHAEAARAPEHWAYWRREPLAYASGVLPSGPGLRAPRCFGVETAADTLTLWLEDVVGPEAEPVAAARALASWQASAPVPDVPWLGGHQLAQRLAVTDLDWTQVDADPRVARVWAARHELMAALDGVPSVLSHGDAGLGNLREATGDVVALDWGTFGVAPVGSDAAHLALSAQADVLGPYVDALDGTFAVDDVRRGYRTTLALVGASRVHWMLAAGVSVPRGYVDLLWRLRPDGVR
ncbi:aminoglycoside phosphotransferase family protein [Beutenbergia cavernae]|nr:aminoglycoside phosphotransferase family protein [Beutenbergia cavernae]